MGDSMPTGQPEQASAPDMNAVSSDGVTKKRRTILIVVSFFGFALFLCVALCLVVFVGNRESPVRLFLDLRDVSAVADRFVRELEKKDAEAAYALLSTRAQQNTTLASFQETFDSTLYVHVEGYESLSVTDGGSFNEFWDVASNDAKMPQGTVAELEAVVKYEGGFEGTLTATFEKEDGKWRVHYLHITAPPSKTNSP